MWKYGRILQFLVANATILVAMYSVDCYEWSELRDSTLVRFLCSEWIDDWMHNLYTWQLTLKDSYLMKTTKQHIKFV